MAANQGGSTDTGAARPPAAMPSQLARLTPPHPPGHPWAGRACVPVERDVHVVSPFCFRDGGEMATALI